MKRKTFENWVMETWPYNESGRNVPCKFEDYLKIDFHDWMTVQYCFVICFRSIRILALVGMSVCMEDYKRSSFPWKPQWIRMLNHFFMQRKQNPMEIRVYFEYWQHWWYASSAFTVRPSIKFQWGLPLFHLSQTVVIFVSRSSACLGIDSILQRKHDNLPIDKDQTFRSVMHASAIGRSIVNLVATTEGQITPQNSVHDFCDYEVTWFFCDFFCDFSDF